MRFLLVPTVALLAAALALPAQAAPPRAKDRPVREARPKPSAEEAKPAEPSKPRSRRRWPGSGAVVVVPGSELSGSAERTRADERGAVQTTRLTAFTPLIGGDETRLRQALGQPAAARNEAQGALWTYRMKTCALHVFLTRDANGALRVKGASSGPIQRDAPAPTVDACVAQADPS